MANSIITITFHRDLLAEETIAFKRKHFNNELDILSYLFTWKTTAVNQYEIPVEPEFISPGVRSAMDFEYYFNRDANYGGAGIFIISRNLNVVTIEINDANYYFDEFATISAYATAVIQNTSIPTFEISSKTITSAINKCSFVRLNLVTTENIYRYELNGVSNAITPSTNLNIDIPRGLYNSITIFDVNDYGVPVLTDDGFNIYYPILNSSSLDISVGKSLIGATALISLEDKLNLTLLYSKDGVNYVSQNYFSGLAIGDYTCYVKDQFDCIITKEFSVTEFGTREPYFEISKANSLSFVEIEDVDNCGVFSNETNTFEKDSENNIKYCVPDEFLLCDSIDIQFHSNYETNSVKLRKEDATEVSIPITKQTSNINRFLKTDCYYYRYDEDKTGIYFSFGNYYNESDQIIGQSYLDGTLPEFAIIGQFITVDGLGTFEIKNIIYDEVLDKSAIIIDYNHIGSIVWSKVMSIYDILPYEVYTFNLDMASIGLGTFDVLISILDTQNGSKNLLSENFIVQSELPNYATIIYYNDNNRDIFYKFGQQNLIRIGLLSRKKITFDNSETNIYDSGANLKFSDLSLGSEFIFDSVTEKKMERLAIALSSKFVFINGIGYVKAEPIEVNNIDNTNLYDVKCKMINNNRKYTTKN